MEFKVGIACGRCDTFSLLGVRACPSCGHDLALAASKQSTSSREQLMEQARNYVCNKCSSAVPLGHKFCGSCGMAVPDEIAEFRAEYFGTMQAPGKARLVVIRSGSDTNMNGLSYALNGEQHVAGRSQGQVLFPEDAWLNPRHASFVYEGIKLMVRDEGSVNGVFLRLRRPASLTSGDVFLCGQQVLRVDETPAGGGPEIEDGVYFYASPKHASSFAVTQLVEGGADAMVRCCRDDVVEIGREGTDMNFPNDVYMSGRHARVEKTKEGQLVLSDSGSRNGTYLRISGPEQLEHGDYLFLGKQLLRIEITA
ncbi:MAG: FHA domain-containing protein [Proteobacteria bacterium]|nr:FHA domain-containing protein [Pseudomonadota bacterium]